MLREEQQNRTSDTRRRRLAMSICHPPLARVLLPAIRKVEQVHPGRAVHTAVPNRVRVFLRELVRRFDIDPEEPQRCHVAITPIALAGASRVAVFAPPSLAGSHPRSLRPGRADQSVDLGPQSPKSKLCDGWRFDSRYRKRARPFCLGGVYANMATKTRVRGLEAKRLGCGHTRDISNACPLRRMETPASSRDYGIQDIIPIGYIRN